MIYNLETRHIIQNYKYLKAEMEPKELLDYLVQEQLLDLDENSCLIGLCRAQQCDFILRKFIRYPRMLEKFVRLLNRNSEFNTLPTVQCFLNLSQPIATIQTNPSAHSDVQGKSDYHYSSLLHIS